MTNRIARAWRELTSDGSTKKSYTTGNLLGGFGGFNLVDNTQQDLRRNAQGATLAYMFAPPVKAAVDVIARNVDSVPMVILDKDGNVKARSDENPTDSPVLMAFERSWKYYRVPLRSLIIRSHLLYGMTFLEKVMNEGGFGTNLRWLNPNAVTIDSPRGRIERYRYTGESGYVTLEPQKVLYIREFNPDDDIMGFSPTLNIMAQANAVIHFEKFRAAYYNNGGQPGFAFMPENDVSSGELSRLRDFWKHELTGVENFFKTLISPLRGTLTQFDPIDISKPLEMDKETQRRILKGYGVPPEMIGDTEGNPYQFSPEKKNAFMQTVVEPIAKAAIVDPMNYEGFPALDPDNYRRGYRLAFDFSAYDTVSETTLKEQENVRQNFLNGGLSYNEYRLSIGYEPVASDFHVLPNSITIIPSGDLGQPLLPPPPVDDAPMLPTRKAPPQTEFSSVTYNGVTVQASSVQPSSRDDKKFMRWVRYNDDERLVHWGQPGEQMERDNDEAREAFNSRHSCSEKQDPFAPGFWACWAWQPDADVRSTITLDDLQATAKAFNIPLADTLAYYEEFSGVA